MSSDSSALLGAIERMIGNLGEYCELLGTDHHTYPSKNVEDEETLKKRTDVRGNRSIRKPGLGKFESGPGLQLIGIKLDQSIGYVFLLFPFAGWKRTARIKGVFSLPS